MDAGGCVLVGNGIATLVLRDTAMRGAAAIARTRLPYATQDTPPPWHIFQSSFTPRQEDLQSRTSRRWNHLVESFPKTCRLMLGPHSLRSNRALIIGPGGVVSCVVYRIGFLYRLAYAKKSTPAVVVCTNVFPAPSLLSISLLSVARSIPASPSHHSVRPSLAVNEPPPPPPLYAAWAVKAPAARAPPDRYSWS